MKINTFIIKYISLVIFVLGIINAIQSCPTGCKCRYTQVSCEQLKLKSENLTELADQLSNKTEILYLSNNHIDHFPLHLFAKLKNLRALHLRSNLLTRVPSNTGLYLQNLRELDLEENKINMLTPADFIGYTDVRTLYLQDNELTSLPERTFEKLLELRYLYLENNYIKIIRKNTFSGLYKLLYLNVAENHIDSIEENSFDDCKDIQQIFFNSNQLKNIPNGLFQKSNHINQIDFSSNKIVDISANAFTNMSNIVMVDIVLNSNSLRFIPSSSFKLSNRLRIGLASNVIHCDCKLLSNYYQLLENDIIIAGAYCTSPSNLLNLDVAYVNMTGLNCDLCQPNVCHNNGSCIIKTSGSNPLYSFAVCACTKEFEGKLCKIKKPLKPTTISPFTPCKNNGCRNNGECIAVNKNKYKCKCRSRYFGTLCENFEANKKTNSAPTLATWIAIGVSILVLLLAVCLAVCFCRRKRKQKQCIVEENRILEEKLNEEISDQYDSGTTL